MHRKNKTMKHGKLMTFSRRLNINKRKRNVKKASRIFRGGLSMRCRAICNEVAISALNNFIKDLKLKKIK